MRAETLDPDLSPTVPIGVGEIGRVLSPDEADPARAVPAGAVHVSAVPVSPIPVRPIAVSPIPVGAALAAHALVSPLLGGPASDSTAVGGTRLGRRALGSWAPGSWVRSALRGLLVTPWFAASTGFVIAAAMWLYSPHASISFPSAIGTVHCQLQGCATPGGRGSLATSAPGQRLAPKHEGGGTEQQVGASKITAGLKFTFTVLWHRQNSFGAMVTISGRRSFGSWHLAFRLPGTQIQNVFGAEWLQLASHDGGTASPFDPASGWPAGHRRVSFRVFGTGNPGRPTSCTFDGASCTFKVTSGRAHGGADVGQSGGGQPSNDGRGRNSK
ncbi:MAG: hypothetical protein ACLQFR_02955 [Streptosporangiaceae bacterium]